MVDLIGSRRCSTSRPNHLNLFMPAARGSSQFDFSDGPRKNCSCAYPTLSMLLWSVQLGMPSGHNCNVDPTDLVEKHSRFRQGYLAEQNNIITFTADLGNHLKQCFVGRRRGIAVATNKPTENVQAKRRRCTIWKRLFIAFPQN